MQWPSSVLALHSALSTLVAGTLPLAYKHLLATSTWLPLSAWPSSHNTGTGSLSPTSLPSPSPPQRSLVSTRTLMCPVSSSTRTPGLACSTTHLNTKSRPRRHLRRSRLLFSPQPHKPSAGRSPRIARTAARAWILTSPQHPSLTRIQATRWMRTTSLTHQSLRTRRRSLHLGRSCRRRR